MGLTETRIIHYYVFILMPIWMFNFIGTWYDVGLIPTHGHLIWFYYAYSTVVCVWAALVVPGIDIFLELEDIPGKIRSRSAAVLSPAIKGTVIGGMAYTMFV